MNITDDASVLYIHLFCAGMPQNIQQQLKNKKKPIRYHLLFYCTSYRLNISQALPCPSLGARDYVVDYHIGRFILGLL